MRSKSLRRASTPSSSSGAAAASGPRPSGIPIGGLLSPAARPSKHARLTRDGASTSTEVAPTPEVILEEQAPAGMSVLEDWEVASRLLSSLLLPVDLEKIAQDSNSRHRRDVALCTMKVGLSRLMINSLPFFRDSPFSFLCRSTIF